MQIGIDLGATKIESVLLDQKGVEILTRGYFRKSAVARAAHAPRSAHRKSTRHRFGDRGRHAAAEIAAQRTSQAPAKIMGSESN